MQFTVSRSFTVLTSVLGWVLESSDSMLGRTAFPAFLLWLDHGCYFL